MKRVASVLLLLALGAAAVLTTGAGDRIPLRHASPLADRLLNKAPIPNSHGGIASL